MRVRELMPKAKRQEPEGTTLLRLNTDLAQMVVAVVNWKKAQPNATVKTVAQYLDILLRDAVEADFSRMAAAQQAAADRLNNRK